MILAGGTAPVKKNLKIFLQGTFTFMRTNDILCGVARAKAMRWMSKCSDSSLPKQPTEKENENED